ncbi:MAG: T9SS type A sorting domain-containing protein, partial [Bacteroidota bacterium]
NPSTTIQFALPVAGNYSLKVYNIIGQEVANLIQSELTAGVHKINFDASRLASGVYFYRLSGKNVNISKKMLLIK